jgi:hypothetical protein
MIDNVNLSKIVTPNIVASTFRAVKLHFSPGSYDAFKYHFKSPGKCKSDHYVYQKIARKYNTSHQKLIYFIVANWLSGNTWIGNMNEDAYHQWEAKMQRLAYTFNNDMTRLHEHAIDHNLTFDDCLTATEQKFPAIITLARKHIIEVESVIIVDVLVNFLKRINKISVNDPFGILNDTVYFMERYKPFILPWVRAAAAKNVVINLFTDVHK